MDYVSSYSTLAKIDGGMREPCPFHYMVYKTVPEGAFGSYFYFLFLVYLPFEAKFATANFFYEAVIVLELAPGRDKVTVSITWLMNPDLTIWTATWYGAE